MKLLVTILLLLLLLFGGCLQQQKTVTKPAPVVDILTPEPPAPAPPAQAPSVVPPIQDELLTGDIDTSLEDLDQIGDLNLSDSLLIDLEN